MDRRHINGSIETVASTPSDFVEAAVRGRIGDMESLASTPPYFVEAADRGSIGELESLASTPPGFTEAVFRKNNGIAFGFHRRIERLTMLEYRGKFSACHPTLL